MVQILKKYKYPIALAVTCLSIIIYKLKFLVLPYYWDEAWPYGVAVRTMQHNGVSLLPGAISVDLSRGHPLLFHFLAASWMDVFGNSLLSGHSFALLVSLLLLIVVYVFGATFFSARTGFVAAILLASQAIYLTQSAFLLPEMMLSLWVMLSCFFHMKEKIFLFWIFTIFLLLTKESGFVLLITFAVFDFLFFLFTGQKNIKEFIHKLSVLGVPILVVSIFFVVQKMKFGWFFFPLHINYMKTGLKSFGSQIPQIFSYIFIYYGRNGIFFSTVAAAIYLNILKNKTFNKQQKKIISLFLLFTVFFMLFSAVNISIPRYLMCVFPVLSITCAAIIDGLFMSFNFRGKNVFFSLLIMGFIVTALFYYYNQSGNDKDYSGSILLQEKAIKYCEDKRLTNKHIFTNSVLRIDLTEPYAGFIKKKEFDHTDWAFTTNTQYCIFSSDEYDYNCDEIKKRNKMYLVIRFEDKKDWVEIYKVI